jgi:hypothetical protein
MDKLWEASQSPNTFASASALRERGRTTRIKPNYPFSNHLLFWKESFINSEATQNSP